MTTEDGGHERRRRVLIVDDETANVRVLAAVLADGYEIHFATDGERALELATAVSPEIILLDVVMSGIDGFDVLRRLKADPATTGIPVIFVTAASEVDDEARGFALGAVDYIAKPISPPVVRARVKTHLELRDQRDLLAKLASIDGLTGLANRRRFDEHLDLCWRQGLRTGEPLSLFLIDVDFFKQFNDRCGHLAGDECLRRLASTLASAFGRADDLTARYGGEELAVVLPRTPAAGARQLAERVLERVRRLAIPHPGSSVADHVTVSLGAVTRVPTSSLTPSSLVEAADRLLYDAKQKGRNRCAYRDLDGTSAAEP